MGCEYRLTVPNYDPRKALDLVRTWPLAHQSPEDATQFEIRTDVADYSMPDAIFHAQPNYIYFCDYGGRGREFLGKVISQLTSEFGSVTVEDLE